MIASGSRARESATWRRRERPYLVINATDMATGQHFVFSHLRFALIGSGINESSETL
jgi:hypothetical protein